MEKIKEILSKESLNEQDVNYLIKNKDILEQKDLERLGLAPKTPDLVVEEQVSRVPTALATPVEEVQILSPEAKVAKKIIEEQSLPPKKKAGRPAKIV